jgi:hypothetical protein
VPKAAKYAELCRQNYDCITHPVYTPTPRPPMLMKNCHFPPFFLENFSVSGPPQAVISQTKPIPRPKERLTAPPVLENDCKELYKIGRLISRCEAG